MDLALVLIVVLILVLVWRGPRTLPQIGAMLGRGVRSIRREVGTTKSDSADRDERA